VTVTPAADAEVNTALPSIVLQVNDASGVDFSRLFLSLDGQDVSGQATHSGADRIEYQASGLAEGWHRIEYRVVDTNGNVTAGDQLFAVLTGGPRIYIDSEAVQLYPGGTFELPIRAMGAERFGNFKLRLDYDATKTSMTVENADLAATNVVQQSGVWQGEFSGFSSSTGVIATLKLHVKDYIQNTFVAVAVSGMLDGATYYHPTIRKPVGSKYKLMTSWGLQGAASQFLVVDNAGKPAANVNVEMVTYDAANDVVKAVTPLGLTNAEGLLTVQLNASGRSEELIFRAYDATGSSLMTKVESLIERLGAAPRYLFLTPTDKPTAINVTWFTATGVTSSNVRYGIAGRPASSASGTSEIVPFFYGTEAGAVRVHHARMTQLKPGQSYEYSVGDGGTNSSPTYHFSTDDGDSNVNIHLFGDTQTLSDENIYNGSALVKQLQSKMQAQLPQEDLILHVGDITDDLTDYRLLRLFFEALEGEERLASHVFVPTQGNHEVLNEGAAKFASIFVNPANSSVTTVPYDKAVYSFDYGNAHIAVLSSEVGESDWPVMMSWLERDMRNSSKTWKIVMLHRPPYNGNPASGNERSQKYLPPVVDAAGIDLVIAGHDHMYARTAPLRGGQRHSGGATYLIAGSDSAKFYDNNGSGIASLAEVLYDDNRQTFTTLAIRGNVLHVLTRAMDGTVVDDATLYSTPHGWH
jgi:methionine-rich copper-binding protein CopC